MGGKESKPSSLSYEEAVKRVSEAQLSRLKDAYKRTATLGTVSKQTFVREVLGDGVPQQLAELIFTSCGGASKGISFRDLFCSLVLLTKGTKDEKIKFIFAFYANESTGYVSKSEILRQLQTTEDNYCSETLQRCFSQSDKVYFEEFRFWLLDNHEATTITRWLLADHCFVSLSNDVDTPNFHQTLAGVTHLEENEVLELENRYWHLKSFSPSGKLDSDTLVPMIDPPLPRILAQGVFNAFDENRDNHIDFKEMACGISAACRGPEAQRQKFCFKIFDRDRDGKLNKEEFTYMAQSLLLLQDEEAQQDEEGVRTGVAPEKVQQLLKELGEHSDLKKNDYITLEEYMMWTLNSPLADIFLQIIFQVCHIVLGLRPSSRREEGEIVCGWLRRAEKRPLSVGYFWYIINIDWWNTWLDYVCFQDNGNEFSSLSLNSSLAVSQTSSIKKTKLQKKSANADGLVASDFSAGVSVTSIASFSNGDSSSLTSIESTEGGRNTTSLFRHSSFASPRKNMSSSNLSVVSQDSTRSGGSDSPRLQRRVATSPACLGSATRPSAIDNSSLVEPSSTPKIKALTGEGGRLKRNVPLVQGRDFVLVPESLWKALKQWYDATLALPRQVIHGRSSGEVELELYPLTLKLLRHVQQPTRVQTPNNNWAGMVGGYGAAALNANYYVSSPFTSISQSAPKRYLSNIAAFSRLATLRQIYDYLSGKLKIKTDDMRLWHIREEPQAGMTLLEEDENTTLEGAYVTDMSQILLEVRNKDLTWPEEICSITSRSPYGFSRSNSKIGGTWEKGMTGLNNLGNTCFMNAALQCCSNTKPLTNYFITNRHLYEINISNPCGMKGNIACQYGNLIHQIWNGETHTVAPLKLRWIIGKYSGNFTGFQQHDSQELLAFLLDGLHEDLNRVHNKPYIELKDSEGRPDTVVAQEAWENHILRNKSIIVDLFHGQLKSKVTCSVCGNESARFDPFTYLTLQLPMESYIYMEVVVVKLDGKTPFKYGLRLISDSRYIDVKKHLHILTNIPVHQFMLTEVNNAQIKGIQMDDCRVRSMSSCLYAYELPSPVLAQARETRATCKSARDRQLFTQIQRTAHQSSPNLSVPPDLIANLGDIDAPENINSPLNSSHSQESELKEALPDEEEEEEEGCLPPNVPYSIQHDNDLHNAYKGFLIAFHRKMIPQEVYFLSSQKNRPNLFGQPLVVPCHGNTTYQDLYRNIWLQVSRLVSPLPPSEALGLNHAHDCDDSLGYEFPFTLRVVDREGIRCVWCPWYQFCRGCELSCDDHKFPLTAAFLAIEWDPTALHLRYQSSLERTVIEHSSVEEMRRKHTEPISLGDCLGAFCSEETLDYMCEKCKKLQRAAKKLQIWRLPPLLIVHLKRFQFVGTRWVKSQKIVNFPIRDFDPTNYLASVPKQTILIHRAELEGIDPAMYIASLQEKDNVFLEVLPENKTIEQIKGPSFGDNTSTMNKSSCNGTISVNSQTVNANNVATRNTPESEVKKRRMRNGSVLYGDALQDFHQHRLLEGKDSLELKYNLYAVACHSGIMEGGHYVCYAKNKNDKWTCFNDSSCKEVSESQVDMNSAYILFYQREGLDVESYMPHVNGKVAYSTKDMDEETEAEYKKNCSIM